MWCCGTPGTFRRPNVPSLVCILTEQHVVHGGKLVSLRNRTAERRGQQITCAWRTWQGNNLRILSWSWLTSMFSGLLQKDLFKRKWSLAKSYFKQNYCHACHTRFAVFFPLPSCCVSSLIPIENPWKCNFQDFKFQKLMFLDASALKILCLWCEFQGRQLFIISLLLKTFR